MCFHQIQSVLLHCSTASSRTATAKLVATTALFETLSRFGIVQLPPHLHRRDAAVADSGGRTAYKMSAQLRTTVLRALFQLLDSSDARVLLRVIRLILGVPPRPLTSPIRCVRAARSSKCVARCSVAPHQF